VRHRFTLRLNLTAGVPQHGQLIKNPDGSYLYSPDANWNGVDSFSYKVNDGELDSNLARVTLTIIPVNDAPVARDDAFTLDEDRVIHLDLLANDGDVEGDALRLILLSQPAHGSLTLNPDNSLDYRPQAQWSGEDGFSYRINDGELDSPEAQVRLIVNPVADAPLLIIDEATGPSREIFRTGWESVPNRNRTSTLVPEKTLDGWTRITRPDPSCGGANGFEIWSSGDRMHNAQNKLQTVQAAPGNGNNWLELNDARGEGHQTLAIERQIETLAGATYTLSLDLAGRLGYGADTTRIGITLDGLRIGGDESTSPPDALDWRTRSFQFTGSGGTQTLRIATEATHRDKNGRGMMLDDIRLTETWPANTGFEDSAIRLSALSAALVDRDGSEVLTLAIEAIPPGATLSDGSHRFTATPDQTRTDISGWNLGNLSLTPPPDFNGRFSLQIIATATEQANQAQASTTAELPLNVLPVNDAPLARDARFTLDQDGKLIIDFSPLVSDVDGDPLSLTLTKPKHGSLSRNADGTYTYTPKRGYSGTDGFGYSVTDGRLSASATLELRILPVNHPPVWCSTPPGRVELQPVTIDDFAYRDVGEGRELGAASFFQAGGTAGTSARLTFDWLYREAAYNNEIGLYRVDDASGRIGSLKPGDKGYAAAALAIERAIVLFQSGRGQGAKTDIALPAGQYLGYYLIQNASSAQWRNKNPANRSGQGPLAFFSAPAANPDKIDHLHATWQGNGLRLAWEDQTGGGDRDFDDAIIGAQGLVQSFQPFVYQAKASDKDGDKLGYRLLEGPAGARIDAITGRLTWDKPQPGRQGFRIEVTDGKGGTAEQQFSIDFRAPQDQGHCDGKSASIQIQAQPSRQEDRQPDGDGRYILINPSQSRGQKQAPNGTEGKVDWNGTAPASLCQTPVRTDAWLADLLCPSPQEKGLAELTGLVVRMKG